MYGRKLLTDARRRLHVHIATGEPRLPWLVIGRRQILHREHAEPWIVGENLRHRIGIHASHPTQPCDLGRVPSRIGDPLCCDTQARKCLFDTENAYGACSNNPDVRRHTARKALAIRILAGRHEPRSHEEIDDGRLEAVHWLRVDRPAGPMGLHAALASSHLLSVSWRTSDPSARIAKISP